MTKLQALSIVQLACIAGLDKDVVAKNFVDVLNKYESIYHFDDSAEHIISYITRSPLFNDEESKVCNVIRDYCYGDVLFNYSLEVMCAES